MQKPLDVIGFSNPADSWSIILLPMKSQSIIRKIYNMKNCPSLDFNFDKDPYWQITNWSFGVSQQEKLKAIGIEWKQRCPDVPLIIRLTTNAENDKLKVQLFKLCFLWKDFTSLGNISWYISKLLYLGRNSVTIERFGGRVTAPMKRTTFGWRNLRIMRT